MPPVYHTYLNLNTEVDKYKNLQYDQEVANTKAYRAGSEGDHMSEYLTYKEACEILHLKSYKGLYYLIKNGLPVIVIGNSKRISANDLKKFMEDHTVTTAPKD